MSSIKIISSPNPNYARGPDVRVIGQTGRGTGTEFVYSWFTVTEVLEVLLLDDEAREKMFFTVDAYRYFAAREKAESETAKAAS